MTPGDPARSTPVFDFSGGAPCLDFANTWSERARPETDKLGSYQDLVAFARQAEIITDDQAERLLGESRGSARKAKGAFARALDLRESIYRLFSALASGAEPSDADLDRVNQELSEALHERSIQRRGSRFVWTWNDLDTLSSPLLPIAYSAAELLTGSELDRVRECDGRTCTWLFLDQSRNRSRRWCDMSSCGNRAKQRRHYARQRQPG